MISPVLREAIIRCWSTFTRKLACSLREELRAMSGLQACVQYGVQTWVPYYGAVGIVKIFPDIFWGCARVSTCYVKWAGLKNLVVCMIND